MLKRTIKRPSRHAPTLSLLPLLCAVLLLLSACDDKRSIIPPSENGTDVTNSGETSVEAVGGETSAETVGEVTSAEAVGEATSAEAVGGETSNEMKPLPVLTGPEQNTLTILKHTVSYYQKLENLDLQGFEELLSNAKDWLEELQGQTNALKVMLQENHSDSSAPGLEKLSERIEAMLEVITTNQGTAPQGQIEWFNHNPQAAVGAIGRWRTNLNEIASYLPDVPPTPPPKTDTPDDTGESGTGNVDTVTSASLSDESASRKIGELEKTVSELEKTVSELEKTVDEQSGKISELEKTVGEQPEKTAEIESNANEKHKSKKISVFGLVLVVVGFTLGGVLLWELWKIFWKPKKQKTNNHNVPVRTKVTQAKEETKGNPAHATGTTGAMNNQWDDREDFHKKSPQPEPPTPQPEPPTPKLEPPTPRPEPPTPKPEPPTPKPEIYYFAVTSQTVQEGKPIYLTKEAQRGEIVGVSRNDRPTSGTELYDIYPIIPGVVKPGDNVVESGNLPKNSLTSGDIKKCFDISPSQLPGGKQLYVTVKKAAIIQQTAANQYLLEWKYRGQLSVTGGS